MTSGDIDPRALPGLVNQLRAIKAVCGETKRLPCLAKGIVQGGGVLLDTGADVVENNVLVFSLGAEIVQAVNDHGVGAIWPLLWSGVNNLYTLIRKPDHTYMAVAAVIQGFNNFTDKPATITKYQIATLYIAGNAGRL